MDLLRFVVGIDGADASDAALAWSLATASIGGEDLLLVTVVERPAGQTIADCRPRQLEEAERLLARAADRIPEAMQDRVATRILVGPAAQTLAEFCGEGDILVVGTHKTGFLHGRVTGSRSLQLAARARSRLVVVPGVPSTGRRGIVVGLTPGRDWTGAVRSAGVYASRFGEEVRIVQAADPSAVESTWAPQSELAAVDPALLVTAAIEHQLAEEFPGVRVQSRLSQRDAVAAFLDASRAARLLIVPVLDDERAVDFVGSVAHDVLLNINAPVILMPAAVMDGPRPVDSDGGGRSRSE